MAHPRRPITRPKDLAKVREFCLALPGSSEKEAWGSPTFRAKDRMFVMFMDNHHGDGRVALWLSADADARDTLVAADPNRFFVPPYVGAKGWLGVRLDKRLGWKRIAGLMEESYRRVAPKRLCAEFDAR